MAQAGPREKHKTLKESQENTEPVLVAFYDMKRIGPIVCCSEPARGLSQVAGIKVTFWLKYKQKQTKMNKYN